MGFLRYLRRQLNLFWRKGQNIAIYKSLEELKIVLFWTITGSGEIKLLDKNYSPGKKYTVKQIEELKSTWTSLFDEAFKLRSNSRSRQLIREKDRESKLLGKISTINYTLKGIHLMKMAKEYMRNHNFEDSLKEYMQLLHIIEPAIKYNESKGIEGNIKLIETVMAALIDKYKLSSNNVRKAVEYEVKNMYDVVATIESILNCPGAIMANIDKMTFMQWLAYENQAEKKQKNNSNNGKGQQLHRNKRAN